MVPKPQIPTILDDSSGLSVKPGRPINQQAESASAIDHPEPHGPPPGINWRPQGVQIEPGIRQAVLGLAAHATEFTVPSA
jgi:hypothetical protein